MAVNVHFRGICMFCTKAGDLVEVLIPDAFAKKPRETDDDKKHLDGTEARRHFAGILITDGKDSERRELLHEAVVTIVGEENGAPANDPPKANLDDLPQLPSTELRVDKTSKPTSITVKGGSVSTHKSDGRKFTFGAQDEVSDQVEIQFTKATLTITRRTGETKIALDANQKVYVYNFDTPRPSVDELEKTDPSSKDELILDNDFKWHFLLLEPNQFTGTKRLRTWSRGILPCPRSHLDSNRTIAGSTCYPSTIGV